MIKRKSDKPLTLNDLGIFTEEVLLPAMEERFVTKKEFTSKLTPLEERMTGMEERMGGKFDKLFRYADKILGKVEKTEQEELMHDQIHKDIGNVLSEHERRIKSLEVQK